MHARLLFVGFLGSIAVSCSGGTAGPTDGAVNSNLTADQQLLVDHATLGFNALDGSLMLGDALFPFDVAPNLRDLSTGNSTRVEAELRTSAGACATIQRTSPRMFNVSFGQGCTVRGRYLAGTFNLEFLSDDQGTVYSISVSTSDGTIDGRSVPSELRFGNSGLTSYTIGGETTVGSRQVEFNAGASFGRGFFNYLQVAAFGDNPLGAAVVVREGGVETRIDFDSVAKRQNECYPYTGLLSVNRAGQVARVRFREVSTTSGRVSVSFVAEGNIMESTNASAAPYRGCPR